jgi:cysteine desulfurase
VHALVGASSVDSVVRVTGNFASESPLHPAAREALLAAFDQGWADPKKLSQSSAKAAILRNQALENIATHLAIPVDSIEVLGEPALGHYLSIAGLFSQNSTFAYSAIDKGKIRALARSHHHTWCNSMLMPQVLYKTFQRYLVTPSCLLQLANGETGVIQRPLDAVADSVLIAVDATSSGSRVPLPPRWSTALFDSLSWNGPAGLAIMAIGDRSHYSYPLPKIAPISSPGSFSLPLLLASSVALENFVDESPQLRHSAIAAFARIPGARVVAPESPSLPHVFSIVVEGVTGERLVRELASRGMDIDSGSACSPEDLQPSHVLAAMGYETVGHLRITLHAGTTQENIDDLVQSVGEVAQQLR